LDEEKSKHAGLDQETGFGSAKLLTSGVACERCNNVTHLQEKKCNKYDLIMSVFSVSDWSLIMIGLGGLLLLVVTHVCPISILWVGLPKKKKT
jgi:hypothetical protein